MRALNTQMDHRENLILMYILNAGMWLVKGFLLIKILLAGVAGLTTIMAFFNQYKSFTKNYATLWVVLYINNFRNRYRPKMPRRKNPERGIRIKRQKPQPTEDGKEKLS